MRKRAGRVVNPEQANRGSRSLEKKATTRDKNRGGRAKPSARRRRVAFSRLRTSWSRWPATQNCRLGDWGAEQRRWAQAELVMEGDGGERGKKWNRMESAQLADGMRCQWTLFSAARPRRHCGFRRPQARSAPFPQKLLQCCRPCKPSAGPRYRRAALCPRPLESRGLISRELGRTVSRSHPRTVAYPATSPAKLSSRTDENGLPGEPRT